MPGYAMQLRHQQKWGKYGEACLSEGVRFYPVVFETPGAVSEEGTDIIRRLGVALSHATGGDDAQVVQHLFGCISVLLQRGNATLLLNRVPEAVEPFLDGYI